MKFSELSFKKKILLLLTLPMIGFLWLSLSTITQSISTTKEMTLISQLTRLSVVYSNLVHELQKERGMTAGYLGSKGNSFANELKNQRKETERKIAKRRSYWQDHKLDQEEISRLNKTINNSLNELENIRRQVDLQNITLGEALSYYTQLNAKLLSVASINAKISTNALLTKETIAYYNFLQGKERAGIERAVLSNTFSKNAFGKGMFAKFVALLTEQHTYFDNFNAFANESNKSFFAQQLNTAAVEEVIRIRKVAMEKTSQFDIDAQYWFSQSTERIGRLKKTENQLGSELLVLAEKIKSSAFNILLLDILLSALLILLSILISFYTIKELVARVDDLKLVLQQVRDGDDLTVEAKYQGKSELGQIATSLNLTLNKFSGVIDEISTSSMTLASAAEETSITCDHNSESMVEQQDGIALIATAIEELSATVKEVATNTQLTADSAKKADEQAQDGLNVVKTSYQSIEVLAEEIDGLAKRINNLHESSNNITTVIDVIKSVAEQTNLLALNAAIEAARAGEQGRGFAVVADEVRTLAQRTQESTAEIESFIVSLQSDANAAFNVIEVSQTKALEAVSNSKNVEHTLEDITQAVSHIFAMTEQIATAIEEQAVVTQDVAQNVVAVEENSVKTTTGSTQIAVTAKEQAQLATRLQDVAAVFKV